MDELKELNPTLKRGNQQLEKLARSLHKTCYARLASM